jgi:hypothetical protein
MLSLHKTDLKAMLKDGVRDAASGNPLHAEMDRIGPMGSVITFILNQIY